MLKGSSLKNTEWVIGIAVYTGHDTKIMQNSSKSVVKQSKNAKALNGYILICMLIQLLCSIVGAIWSTVYENTYLEGAWYLKGDLDEGTSVIYDIVTKTCIWFITLMNFVPISLLVTLEVINSLQAYFMTVDLRIFDEDRGLPAVV